MKEVDSLALSNAQLNVKRYVYEFLSKEGTKFQGLNLKRIMLKVTQQIVWTIRYELRKINIWFAKIEKVKLKYHK